MWQIFSARSGTLSYSIVVTDGRLLFISYSGVYTSVSIYVVLHTSVSRLNSTKIYEQTGGLNRTNYEKMRINRSGWVEGVILCDCDLGSEVIGLIGRQK